MLASKKCLFAMRAVWELLRYDLATAIFGFGAVHRELQSRRDTTQGRNDLEAALSAAVEAATCIYWKRVRCLQRAVATVRLLRAYGIAAELVIGYTAAPFFAHAWVEVNGRVLNGPSALPQKLSILDRT